MSDTTKMRMVIFYCLKTFKSIPRHQDFCTQLTQKDAQIPSYVVVIFHNYNREISENGERHVGLSTMTFDLW